MGLVARLRRLEVRGWRTRRGLALAMVGVLLAGGAAPAFAARGGATSAPAGQAPSVTGVADGFRTPLRLGFRSGDDWETALAADRYGHLYVL
ncbi:MAG: hypothetical protein ACHQZR_07295, partial [Candidatus Limnocylindrales bacterium]